MLLPFLHLPQTSLPISQILLSASPTHLPLCSYLLYHIPCFLYLPCLLCPIFPSNYSFPFHLSPFSKPLTSCLLYIFSFSLYSVFPPSIPSSYGPFLALVHYFCILYVLLFPLILLLFLHPTSVSPFLAYISQFILHNHSPTGADPPSSN